MQDDAGSAVAPYIRQVDQIRSIFRPLHRQWTLNQAFYEGKQYSSVNKTTNRLETLGVDPGDKPRHRVRLVNNQITKNVNSLVAKLTKNHPAFYASPNDTDLDSLNASAVGESLMDWWWTNLRMDKVMWKAVTHARISGGFVKPSWDPEAGEPMTFVLGPDGQPIIETGLQTMFKEELAKMGVDPSLADHTVMVGDIRLDVLSGHQVLLDPSADSFEECKFAICVHGLTPNEVLARWGVRVDADSSPNMLGDIPLLNTSKGLGTPMEKTVKEIFYGYWKPTAMLPKGKYIVFMKNPDKILYESDWPYPFRRLPLIKMPGVPLPGCPYDATEIEEAIPLQRELNRTVSQIIEYKNMNVAPQWTAPVGALKERRTNEPNAVWQYHPVAGLKPERIELGNLPPYILQSARETMADIREAFRLNEVTTGTVPPNVEAAIAIDLMQEMALDVLSPLYKEYENQLADLGNMMLALAGEHYDEARILSMVGSANRMKVKSFLSAKKNLANGAVIRTEAGSSMPRTRAGRQARILQLKAEGIISAADAQGWLDLADFTGLRAKLEADRNQAQREHERLLSGQPINPTSAMEAAMSGDPQAMAMAPLAPTPYENEPIHLEEHTTYAKSAEFERLPFEVQQQLKMHIVLTQQQMAAKQQPQIEPPRVSLQTRMAVGPTVGRELLASAGVDVPPEAMMETPIETVVFDNLDKANEANQLDELRKTGEAEANIQLKRAQAAKALADAEATRRGPATSKA